MVPDSIRFGRAEAGVMVEAAEMVDWNQDFQLQPDAPADDCRRGCVGNRNLDRRDRVQARQQAGRTLHYRVSYSTRRHNAALKSGPAATRKPDRCYEPNGRAAQEHVGPGAP